MPILAGLLLLILLAGVSVLNFAIARSAPDLGFTRDQHYYAQVGQARPACDEAISAIRACASEARLLRFRLRAPRFGGLEPVPQLA